MLTAKSPAWHYEGEVRLIRDKPGTKEIPREYLAQVTFGLKTSDADQALVTSIIECYYSHVDLVKVVRSDSDFNFEFEDL